MKNSHLWYLQVRDVRVITDLLQLLLKGAGLEPDGTK
jgi:hypothetical protein